MREYASRPYADDRDYASMRLLLQDAYAAVGPDVAMTVGDLDYWRFQSADADAEMRSCRLWWDHDRSLVGFAWPGEAADGNSVIDFFAHPDHAPVLEPMLEWAESWHADRRPGRLITTSTLASDSHCAAVLTQRGYERTSLFSHWYRVRSLAHPIPECVIADGYAVRSARRQDANAIAAINNASAAGPELTARSCVAIMSAPTYRPHLHIVVEASGSSAPVAFCIAWYDEANSAGLFEPVACHPSHLRRRLATAMISEGLRRLRSLHAMTALVAASGQNRVANALYSSLGFEPRGRKWVMTKALELRG